jgi:hypothetical protein
MSVLPTINDGALDCAGRTIIPSGDSCTVQCDPHFIPSTPTVTCSAGTMQTASCTPGGCCSDSRHSIALGLTQTEGSMKATPGISNPERSHMRACKLLWTGALWPYSLAPSMQ